MRFKRTEETALRGRSKNERTARIINSLKTVQVKRPLSYTGMPKATYMYWQKRFDRGNPDQEIEEKVLRSVKNIRIMDIVEFLETFAIRDIP